MSVPDGLRVVGFVICGAPECERLVLEGISHKTGGLCEECARNGLKSALETVLVLQKGARWTRSLQKGPNTARNARKEAKRAQNPARKARLHASEKARQGALKRLRQAAPELYDLLLADEREKRGLQPWPAETTSMPGSGALAWKTLEAIAFYHALAEQGEPTHVVGHPVPDQEAPPPHSTLRA